MALQRIPYKNFEHEYEERDISILVSRSCTLNVLKILPRDFELTTNNRSYFFNANILSNSSIIILHHIEENPNYLKYHLDIENCDDVIKKLEQIYQGESIQLNEEEAQIYSLISKKLCLQNIGIIFDNLSNEYKIHQQSLNLFFQNDLPKSFIIQTKKAEYKCNEYGILLSTIIRENLSKDPKIDCYFYDYEDEENEFELISNILNFQNIDVNKDNANTILKICKELRIECLIQILTDFINDSQKIDQLIENKQSIVDSINDLFDLLYHIKEKTVNLVAEKIIESKWSKTEENIYELAAFIIQVIRSKQELHEYLIDLLLKLSENTTSKLNILLPFIINYTLYDQSLFIFISLLRKRNIISFEKVFYLLLNTKLDDFESVVSLFSEEINEFCSKRNMKIESLLPKSNGYKYTKICNKRKNNNNTIAIAIENDDIDTFQKLISPNFDKNLKEKIKQIPITPNINHNNSKKNSRFYDVTYLDYAALKGSIKCFKYLLLNNQEINKNTLSMAIIGENIEIIRIAFNKSKENDFSIDDALLVSIEIHRNDIFDWIFDMIEELKNIDDLLYCVVKSGNIHALIRIMDRIDLVHTNNNTIDKLINISAENGFYLLTIFLLSINNQKITKNSSFYSFQIAKTGNISIFKLFEQIISENDFQNSIEISINIGLNNIIEYISDLFQKRNIKFGSNSSFVILKLYLDNENLVNFMETINKILTINVTLFLKVLKYTCKSKNIKQYIKIVDLIHEENENNDFTEISYWFIKCGLKEMVKYFFDKKYQIDYEYLTEQIIQNDLVDSNLFPLLLNQMNSDSKKLLMNYCDNFKINENEYSMSKGKNFYFKKFLSIQGIDPNNYFDKNLIREDMFESFLKNYGNDIEKQKWQLEKITKYLIDDIFIQYNCNDKIELKTKILNKIINLNIINPNLHVINNTILTFACQNNSIEIVKSLLLYESIDVNLRIPKTGDTPLITSIKKYNNEITKLLINYPKIKIDAKNYKNETALIYAAKLNQDEIVNLLILKDKDHNYDIFLSNLKKIKQYILNTSLHAKKLVDDKMVLDEVITIQPKKANKFDFIVDFPNILKRDLNEPIVSPIYHTNSICEQFIIDFTTSSFIFKILDFPNNGSFLKCNVTFLNQNIEKSKKIEISFLYCLSFKCQSQQIPISIQEISDPQNGWLFDGSLRCQLVFESSMYSKSYLYAMQMYYNIEKFRYIIPISLFNIHIKEKLIKLNPIEHMKSTIYPFIVFDYIDDGLLIQTTFNIICKDDNELLNIVSYFENKDQNKNEISIFADAETSYAKMDQILVNKNLDESNLVFKFNESKKVLYLDLIIQHFSDINKESNPWFLDSFVNEDSEF